MAHVTSNNVHLISATSTVWTCTTHITSNNVYLISATSTICTCMAHVTFINVHSVCFTCYNAIELFFSNANIVIIANYNLMMILY